jgi:Rtf2 RING-finger
VLILALTDSVHVQALMDKNIPKALAHITSLKHVIDLHLTRADLRARGRSTVATSNNFQPGNDAEFVCPITGLEMNGKYRFVVLQRSGHVISEKALKQVPVALNFPLVLGPLL